MDQAHFFRRPAETGRRRRPRRCVWQRIYRFCWCSSNLQNNDLVLILSDIGRLNQSRTCTSGQPCAFTNITGLHLSDGDRIMVLDTCGRDGLLATRDVRGLQNG
eukprot:s386_g34.t1